MCGDCQLMMPQVQHKESLQAAVQSQYSSTQNRAGGLIEWQG